MKLEIEVDEIENMIYQNLLDLPKEYLGTLYDLY